MRTTRPGGVTVLVVDDDPQVLGYLREFLRLSRWRVLEAGDTDAGLKIAREHDGPIHLLITDVALGGMSGVELEDEIRRLRPDIRVLFISGSPEGRAVEGTPLPRGKAYLQKPFSLPSFTAKLEELLR
jgi:two-component system cell cycle sensor histidine kinase/response regulator CckA